MIITEFPLFGLLYIRTKLLWTLPGFCYILIPEKNTACLQAADEVILWHYWNSGERWLIRRKPIRATFRGCGLPIFKRKEKEIYAQLLKNPDEVVRGTVKELAEKYGVDIMTMTGFLDGIDESLVEANPIEEMEEDTEVNLGFDKARLYKNMVAAGADWLYNLEEWNDIFDEETRKALYKEQKSSTTIVKEKKIYPNDPCPCGSGKKYKKCCGRNK